MTSSGSSKYWSAQTGSGSGSSHKPHKHKDHSSSSKATSSSKSNPANTTPDPTNISFLFVVNEFKINFEDSDERDQWLNYVPPSSPNSYDAEYPGTVFRYRNGTIAAAPGYIWDRPAMGSPGRIVYQDPTTGFITIQPDPYKTESIFSCNAHLPLITLQGDASLGSFLRTGCRKRCDEAVDDDIPSWNMLHFAHREGGVSLANSRCSGCTYVAGRNASWMPSLVPRVFENTTRYETPKSRGLGGDLPVVIGLMAFHASKVGHASGVFSSGMWKRGQWRPQHAQEPPKGYPETPFCNPRGFMVQVCPDLSDEDLAALEMDYTGSYMEAIRWALENLESNAILVEG